MTPVWVAVAVAVAVAWWRWQSFRRDTDILERCAASLGVLLSRSLRGVSFQTGAGHVFGLFHYQRSRYAPARLVLRATTLSWGWFEVRPASDGGLAVAAGEPPTLAALFAKAEPRRLASELLSRGPSLLKQEGQAFEAVWEGFELPAGALDPAPLKEVVSLLVALSNLLPGIEGYERPGFMEGLWRKTISR